MLIDGWRCDENDPWFVSYHERVSDDALEVFRELGQGNVLLVRTVGK